jgi:hypothetical protein
VLTNSRQLVFNLNSTCSGLGLSVVLFEFTRSIVTHRQFTHAFVLMITKKCITLAKYASFKCLNVSSCGSSEDL